MKFEFLYGFIPVPVFFTNLEFLYNPGTIGRSFGVFIVIKPKYEFDDVILQHELIHCKQFISSFGINGIRYLVNPNYRMLAELEAYQTLYDAPGIKEFKLKLITRLLFNNYNLEMDKTYIFEKVKDYYIMKMVTF